MIKEKRDMCENFKNVVMVSSEKEYKKLHKDVKAVEQAIEKFLSRALECTSVMAEKDFFASCM